MNWIDPEWLSVSLPRERLCQLLSTIEMQIEDLTRLGIKPAKLLVDWITYRQICAYLAIQEQPVPAQTFHGLELVVGPYKQEIPCVLAEATSEFLLWQHTV